jgi:hypothetical protein
MRPKIADNYYTVQPLQNKHLKWLLVWNNADRKLLYNDLRFEVFTAVTIKNVVFWNVTPCSFCVNRSFGGSYRLHLYGRRIYGRGASVSK